MIERNYSFLVLLSLILAVSGLTGCSLKSSVGSESSRGFTASGKVNYLDDQGLEDVVIHFSSDNGIAQTDSEGSWTKRGLSGSVTVTPMREGYSLEPTEAVVDQSNRVANFTATSEEFNVLSTSPYDGQEGVKVKQTQFGSEIVITFNSKIGSLSQAASAIDISPSDAFGVYGLLQSNVIKIHSGGHLPPFETTFRVTIETTLFDDEGRRLQKPYTFSFTTEADTYPPDRTDIGVLFTGNTADIAWARVGDNPRSNFLWKEAAAYQIYRKENQGEFKVIATVSSPTSSYIDENLEPGTYTYYVTAVDEAGNESAPSNKVTGVIE